jgi:hypothetical protein
MTSEIPQDQKRCTECHKRVRVEKNDHGKLQMTCGCDQEIGVRVSSATPRSWSL